MRAGRIRPPQTRKETHDRVVLSYRLTVYYIVIAAIEVTYTFRVEGDWASLTGHHPSSRVLQSTNRFHFKVQTCLVEGPLAKVMVFTT